MTYYETDYPDTTLTLDDATVREWGGACPFQATGSINGEFFYFRLRHGYASLEVGSYFDEGISVDNSEWGYLDGGCSYSEFEAIFNHLMQSYHPKKTPVGLAGSSRLSFEDAVIESNNGYMITGTVENQYFTMEMEQSTIKMNIDFGTYEREITLEYGEYDDMISFDEDSPLEEIFNRLIADYS